MYTDRNYSNWVPGYFYSIAIRKNPCTNEVGSPGRCGLGVPGYRVYRLLVGLELRDQKP